MTKRPTRRDFKKYPMTEIEKQDLLKILRRRERQQVRRDKEQKFLERARKHNTERGISPKKRREL